MKPLLVTSGEPAGIGPDICLALANCNIPLVVMGDIEVLASRARMLQMPVDLCPYSASSSCNYQERRLWVYDLPTAAKVEPGVLNPLNVPYVIAQLNKAISLSLQKEFSALVTAPVHKAIINQAGISFTGHTEFLQEACSVKKVVMMLVSSKMRVALATTHLPLKEVPQALQYSSLLQVLEIVHQSLQRDFGISSPKIKVAGLNPHAGEGGYLGKEEQEILLPAILALKRRGLQIEGPFAADTLFSEAHCKDTDAFVAMYHDQGLPVIKYASFGEAVNITLGLPIVRTSVDHGTALELAGTGKAQSSSLLAAVKEAYAMSLVRESGFAS